MRLMKGCTRLVILTETVAIKIALPFRPFAPFGIILRAFLKGELRGKLKKYNGNLIRLAVRVATIAGIDANRREIRLSREHPEYPIAPVLRSYLWGFVIVMVRGEPIEELSEPWGGKISLPAHLQESDLFYHRNTCHIEGKFYFIDYGSPTADEVLSLLFGKHGQKFVT